MGAASRAAAERGDHLPIVERAKFKLFVICLSHCFSTLAIKNCYLNTSFPIVIFGWQRLIGDVSRCISCHLGLIGDLPKGADARKAHMLFVISLIATVSACYHATLSQPISLPQGNRVLVRLSFFS